MSYTLELLVMELNSKQVKSVSCRVFYFRFMTKLNHVVFQVVSSVSACTRSSGGAGICRVSEHADEGSRPTGAGPPGSGPGV